MKHATLTLLPLFIILFSSCQSQEKKPEAPNNLWKSAWNDAFDEAGLSFHFLSTYRPPVPNKADEFIYLGDRWTPKGAIDGRYIWLPLRFSGEKPVIEWKSEWKKEEIL